MTIPYVFGIDKLFQTNRQTDANREREIEMCFQTTIIGGYDK